MQGAQRGQYAQQYVQGLKHERLERLEPLPIPKEFSKAEKSKALKDTQSPQDLAQGNLRPRSELFLGYS